MESEGIKSAVELVWEQYQEITDHDNPWEWAFLKDEAQKGVDELGAACRVLFGIELDWALYHAIEHAKQLNEHAYSIFDVLQDEESKIAAILMAHELSIAAKLIHRIQRKQGCSLVEQSRRLSRSADYYAKRIQERIDPDGSLYHGAVEHVVSHNLHDTVRDELI